jgi:hypothetical protein
MHACTAARAICSAGVSGPRTKSSSTACVLADRPQHILGLLTAAEQKQVYRANGGRLRCAVGRRGEPDGQIQVELSHRVLRGLQIQLRIRGQIGFQGEQRPAHRGLHVGVGVLGKPLSQPATDLRKIHLACSRAP